jgi:hypothetical protein
MRLATIVLALAIASICIPAVGQTMQSSQRTLTSAEPVHLTTSFRFEVHAPFSRVAPLFGPESEKTWAGEHWQPEVLYPRPAKDSQGAVFTVPHGPHKSIWVNTIYDVPGGRMQYVAVIPEVVATVIDVRVTSIDPSQTAVDVTYTRTALDPEANDDVRSLAHHDGENGPDWQKSIESSLAAPSR